jgi:hypothetical protein
MAIAFQLCFRIRQKEDPTKQGWIKFNGTYQFLVYANDVSLLGNNVNTIRTITEALIDAVSMLV